MNPFKHILLITALLLMVACSSLPGMKPEPPTVSVAGVRPISLSLSKQELEFTLRVANPNSFDLPLTGLDFTAQFAGEDFATGKSREEVTIPGRGEALVSVTVDAGLGKMLSQFRRMLDSGKLALDYGVNGTVNLGNWPRPIPFDVVGELEDPTNRRASDQ